MKTKRKILSLTISALLMAGITNYPMTSYADKTKVKENDNLSNATPTAAVTHTDSNERGSSDRKVTICHVPPGNPANKHTIHIAYSAWAAHKNHRNDTGPDYADYLGSCNSKTTTTAKESLHVISGCTGTPRETLETKVQAYYEPITVADTALDDQTVLTAMSQCLDNGDSSDSSHEDHDHSSSSTGKGGGHDSVSDSGRHHRIRGCQDKSGDSNKYHQTLKTADTTLDTNRSTKDPIVVSDSNLDDKDVWSAYKACTQDASNANKIDSSKMSKKRGDSGHRQYVLRDHDSVSDSGKQHRKSCSDAQDTTLRSAITTYKAKTSTKDIILTASAYNDVTVKTAIDACVSAGATDKVTDSFSPNIAIHGVTINGATVTNVVVSGSAITGGTITAGTSPTANVVGGTISAGTFSGGTTTGTTLTGATITGATVSTGVSGRLNFRENTSPIKDATTTTDTSTTDTSTTTTNTGTSTSSTPLTGGTQ